MRNDFYPPGYIKEVLKSDLVTSQTREVLMNRLQKKVRLSNPVFDDETYIVVGAVCDCLLPQKDRTEKIPLPVLLEEMLMTGKGKGWRYEAMPSDYKAIIQGIKGIENEAQKRYGQLYQNLTATQQQTILTDIQINKVDASIWQNLPADLFFTELLALLTQLYYSHPLAKEEIGEVAFADAKGWEHIGLNDLEAHEPEPLTKPDAA